MDPDKVDRYDMAAVTRKLTVWCDNQVRRHGLAYVLVPERHKDGAIHFHGFFNGAPETVDNGTMTHARQAPEVPYGGSAGPVGHPGVPHGLNHSSIETTLIYAMADRLLAVSKGKRAA